MNNFEMIIKAQIGNGPLVAAAIHDGHEVRQEVAELLKLPESERLREEDPFTSEWTAVADTRVIGLRSRFEFDLNRPRDNAVYIKPEDAWGLDLWKNEPSSEVISRSLALYDTFYARVHKILTELNKRYSHFVILDLHSYNHRREGPDGPAADPELNPEVNIGTGSLDRTRWAPLVDRFITDLSEYKFLSRKLDVRENVKFKGGHFSRWIHQKFPKSACCLAIEFKKFFMDEWTGNPGHNQLKEINLALQSTVPGILEKLKDYEEK